MKTVTVREMRNHYSRLLAWIAAGEEVLITQRGSPVARMTPIAAASSVQVNWADSPAVSRDRSGARRLSAGESDALLAEAGGKW